MAVLARGFVVTTNAAGGSLPRPAGPPPPLASTGGPGAAARAAAGVAVASSSAAARGPAARGAGQGRGRLQDQYLRPAGRAAAAAAAVGAAAAALRGAAPRQRHGRGLTAARRAVAVAEREAEAAVATAEWPAEVDGYACRCVDADVPGVGRVSALVVDDQQGAEEAEEEIPDWVPKSWLSPVVGDNSVGDIYGAIGVWPAAFAAAEALRAWRAGAGAAHDGGGGEGGRPWRCVEIGCGAGFPSLVAARMGASVLAVDTEPLPLALLRVSFDAQRGDGVMPRGASLETFCGDAAEAPLGLDDCEVVVVSDLLYSVELGRSLGRRLGEAARRGLHIVLTDGGRSGRDAFLESFSEALGSPARYESMPVPEWSAQTQDFFDGRETVEVSLLRYSSP